jgi:hypothetical protein
VTQAASGNDGTSRTESGPAPAEDCDTKKGRVLHTRVPAVLELELKRFADRLRVPVSNLVRAILEDALNVADFAGTGIEERLKSAAKVISHERERLKQRAKSDPLAGIVAFQAITMAQPAACAKCCAPLAPGAQAQLGVSDPPHQGANLIVCRVCAPAG